MAWPKGKQQTPEHIAKRFTPATVAKHSASMKKYYQEHPEAIINRSIATLRRVHTPEVFQLIQRYGHPFISILRGRYNGLAARCTNPNDPSYKNYGGRGIQNKFTSLEHFLLCIINELHITTFSQIDGLQIDRIDNNSHYMPGNIRFVTPKENLNNRR